MIEIYKDRKNKFRFRIKAKNYKIIAQSEAYETRNGCLNGIYSLHENMKEMPQIKDLTDNKIKIVKENQNV